jgi:Na+/proline symporter
MGVVHQGSPKGVAIYPFFLVNEMPSVLAGFSIVGFFAIAQGSLDSAMNALAASIVSDIYAPLQRHATPTATAAKPSKLTVAAVGVGMIALALLCSLAFDPDDSTILTFVLGLMNFALSGMLGVFLTALFTKRGNTVTVILALFTGAFVVLLLHTKVMPLWTDALFHTPIKLAWPWWTPIGTTASFLVCISAPRASSAEPAGFPVEPAA